MLESALGLTFVALIAATLLLLARGRHPSGPWWFRPILVVALTAVGTLVTGTPASVGVGVAVATGFVSIIVPRDWTAIGATFFATLVSTAILYSAYLAYAAVLLGGEPISLVLGVVLLLLELGAMGLILASAFEMIDALCVPVAAVPTPPQPIIWPVVCIQVPAYNEPPELVIGTVESLLALEGPPVRVQVIDNNTPDEALWRPVEAACARFREAGHQVEFVHLPEWPGFKAGALNWGLAHLAADVDVIGIVDADYVVEPGWLRATVPYFADPDVAFVQTPQEYRDWEDSAFYRACHAGFAYFFKVGMVSRARRNAIIFAGTMGLIRRSALEAIGGWDEAIITEDAEASLRILARGGRAIYVPTAYGRGIMPLTYEGLRKQRFRWAFGGIQILRRHWRLVLPWNRRSGLTAGQRYDHLIGGLWWFNDALTFAFSAFVAAAALGAVLGRPFIVQRLSGIGLVLPAVFIVLNLVRYLWGLRAVTGATYPLALAGLRVNLSLSWVIGLACLRALTHERGVFLRTPKFQGAAAVRELRLVWVETVLAAALIGLLVAVVLVSGYSLAGIVLALLLAWGAVIYGSATGYALGDPARAPISDVLREKAALELAPRVGRVVQARSTRIGVVAAGLVALVLFGSVASESNRAPVAGLPAPEADGGPLAPPRPSETPAPTASPSPGPSGVSAGGGASPNSGSSSPTGGPGPAGPGSGGASPTARPTGAPTPGSTPAPTPTPTTVTPTPVTHPTPVPRPSPPVPTPSPQPTRSPRPTATPHPTPPPKP